MASRGRVIRRGESTNIHCVSLKLFPFHRHLCHKLFPINYKTLEVSFIGKFLPPRNLIFGVPREYCNPNRSFFHAFWPPEISILSPWGIGEGYFPAQT